MTIRNVLFPLVLALFMGCSTPKQEEQQLSNDVLQGSWKLIKYINHAQGGTEWESYPGNVIYQKHITPTHFTWIRYEKDKDELVGIGGGRYTFEGNTYTEDIEFFLPPGSSELGQAIPFRVKIDENGQWHHNGYARQFEFDVDTGEMVVSDSVQIEEIWEKITESGEDSAVEGAWELESYRPAEEDSLRSEYPSFVKYIKLLTPSHFIWIKYNGEGDEVMAAGGGTYSYSPTRYVEKIEMFYPSGSRQMGTSPEFEIRLEADRWYHLGEVYKLDSLTGEPGDSSLVDEIWAKVLE